jgi:hypothetical protein
MARKISGGIGGEPNVSEIMVTPVATLVAASDQDISISPQGTGRLLITANAQMQAQSDLRFADADSSNWVAFQAPASVAANVTWTLPATDGSAGQALVTNASGTLSWATNSVSLTDNTTDAATHFVTLTTATSDTTITAVRRSSSKLTFQPSSGILSVTELRVAGLATRLAVENVQSSSYTCVLADAGKVVTMDNTSSATITIPPNSSVAFPIGTIISIARINTGSVALTAGAGVTLTGNTSTGAMFAGEELICRKRSTDTWLVISGAPASSAYSASGGTVSTAGGFRLHQFTSVTSYTFG